MTRVYDGPMLQCGKKAINITMIKILYSHNSLFVSLSYHWIIVHATAPSLSLHSIINLQDDASMTFCSILSSHLIVFLFIFRFSDKMSCENSIHVEGNRISIEDVVSSVTFEFKDLKFDPSTCRTLQYTGQGSVTFTLQVEKPPSEILSVSLRNNDQQEQFVKEIKANQNRCYCKFCGQKILKDTW